MLRKIKRTLTSILPVSPKRRGACAHCGACCKLALVCPFLKTRADGSNYCVIYLFRPPACRKYPRSASEHITQATCGFSFDEQRQS